MHTQYLNLEWKTADLIHAHWINDTFAGEFVRMHNGEFEYCPTASQLSGMQLIAILDATQLINSQLNKHQTQKKGTLCTSHHLF